MKFYDLCVVCTTVVSSFPTSNLDRWSSTYERDSDAREGFGRTTGTGQTIEEVGSFCQNTHDPRVPIK